MAVACEGSVQLWDLQGVRRRATLTGHRHRILALAYAPDGAVLASAGNDMAVRLWHLPTAQELYILRECREEPHALAFSRDRKSLTVACGVAGISSEVLSFSGE